MTSILHDLRYAMRQMGKSPGFTSMVVLTIALGIGANTAIFTLTHAVMLKSLPVPRPEQLYRLGDQPMCCLQSGLEDNWGLFSDSLYRYFRDSTPAFAQLAAFQAGESDLSIRRNGDHPAEHSRGEFVSGNYFSMFGIQPGAGRNIGPADDRLEAALVAMMSYRFWQQHYGLNRSVVGSAITINGTPFTIVGIAPPGFFGDSLREDPPDFWMPLATEPVLRPQNSLLRQPGLNWLYVMGRLKPDAQPSRVAAQTTVELQQWLSGQVQLSQAERKEIAKQVVHLTPGAEGIVGRLQSVYSRGLILLTCISGLVLLIACANIANLLFARGRALRRQLSICLALGASRARLVRQMLTESIVLAILGGTAALALAYGGARLLLALAFRGADYVPISPDPSWPVLGFTFVLSLFTGVVFGIAPAWTISHSDPIEALRGAKSSTDRHSALPQKSLVVLQAALSFVLLVVAGLLAQSPRNLENEQFGFEPSGRWIVNFDPELAGYTPQRLRGLYQQLQDRLGGIPGVKNVGISTYVPMSGWVWEDDVYVEGGPAAVPEGNLDAFWNRISPQYFETVGTPLLRGRAITAQDTPTSRHVAVINQSFAKKFFKPGVDPLGKYFGIGAAENGGSYEIVGVVADAKYWKADAVPAMFFLPYMQLTPYADDNFRKVDVRSNYAHNIELHVTGNPLNLGDTVRRALAGVDPNLTVLGIRTFDEQISRHFNQERLVGRLTSALGILALLLASLGIYGVTSHSVSRRTNEIGIRMALGADRRGVVALMLRGACIQTALGLGIGILAALASTKLLSSQLYGVKAYDPVIFASAAILLSVCGVIASLLPSRRAAKVDPMVALRYE
jgi:predicted permease